MFECEARHASSDIMSFGCLVFFGFFATRAQLKWEERLEGNAPSTIEWHSFILVLRIMQI